MDRERILAIEDDDGVCRLLRHTLAREDFDLQIVTSGAAGLDLAKKFHPNLVLLDLGLPDINGLEVCQRLKSDPETRHLPVIILTGNGSEADVVNGLEIGADDYIIKPVRPRILTARIRAVLRRRMDATDTPKTGQDLKIGQLTVSAQRETVTLAGSIIDLNPSEFHFIHALTQTLSTPEQSEPEDFSIGQEGMVLYAENRLDLLLPLLRELLKTGNNHPLLCKFAGLAFIHADRKQAEMLLSRAAELFAQAGSPVSELSVLAHLILFHVLIDGKIEKATELFQKAERLENPHFEQLSVFSRISVAQALAIGNALIYNNFARAYEYLSIAESLAEDRGLENFRVINLLIHAYNAYVAADTTKLSRTVDETLLLFSHPQINAANKAFLKMAQLLYLSLTGDYTYFRSIEKSLRDEFDALLPLTSLPLRLLTVVQAQSAQVEDDYDTVLSQHASDPEIQYQPIITGMLALSAALSGQSELADKTLKTYLESEHTIPFFDIQGRLYCVRALLALDQAEEAARMLAQLRLQLDSTNWRVIEIQTLALSLLFHRDRPLTPPTLDSLQKLLGEMKETGITHFLCLTRKDLHFILSAAIHHDIERTFAADLCRKLLNIDWNRDWKPVPILQFKTVGGLQLCINNKPLLTKTDFSRSQRDCLALLIAAPNNRVDQEEMQLTFWPDSSPEKARANLDTMLSRLRKLLQEQIKPLAVKNYLKLQKGVISLDYSTFDVDELLFELNRGRKLLSTRDLWRADIAITRGLLLWNGAFIPGSCVSNQATELAEKINQICIKTTLLWGETLTNMGQSSRTIQLLTKALSFDPCNEEVVTSLHRNYMRSNNLTKAGLLLRQYEEALHVDGCSSAEIGRLLTRLRTLIRK